ncbi:MAG: DUF2591 domain-containing protein [Aeromonadaceae bacterium]|nr:DUF2591 domain-containing protein [Aeromonadaceae bacterium]
MDLDALTDQQLNALVAKTLGIKHANFAPCDNWQDAWPLIQRHNIALIPDHYRQDWIAMAYPGFLDHTDMVVEMVGRQMKHTNPLRAAMLAYLNVHRTLRLGSAH